ncbi:uncharacterized protein LOC1279579 isoform X1 [Anopheles gambiae]|uniref:uncharacterized protein LOC1279579 isoform X1 n=2 Tax=Anopheles gambiae TaxID=7165 RepID=UPI002AC9EC7C|nr:uncharacterized protein LOC1279579 isoform X1 [Anopheles gambiae]
MAEESDLMELINRAISCEHPQVYGAVNLNRLREVLCLLVLAQKAGGENPSNAHHLNESTEKDNEVARNHSEVDITSDSCQNVDNLPPSSEQSENEEEINVNDSPTRSPSPEDKDQATGEQWQNVLFEIEKIACQMNEISERVNKIETKWQPMKCTCLADCGATADDENISPSQSNVSFSENNPSTQVNDANEPIFEVGQKKTVNDIDGLPAPREASPSEATDGNEPAALQSTSDQSVVSCKDGKNNNSPLPTTDIVMEQDQEGVNCIQENDEKSTLPASNGTQNEKRKERAIFCDNFEQLVAIVEFLLEREKMFSERLGKVEAMVTLCTDELPNRLEEEDGKIPPSMGWEAKSPVQNSIQDPCTVKIVPETVAEQNNLKREAVASSIHTKVDEIENELGFLKATLNNLNIAAGGKLGAEVKNHVHCISCNCAAAMEVFETPIPQPIPFHVKRCLKPVLRRQLDSLRKELKDSVGAPVDMEPYWQLLKKPNSLRSK